MGKANFTRTPLDLTRKNIYHDKVLFGLSRQSASGVNTSVSSVATGGGSSVLPVTGFLPVAGGSMQGAIALNGIRSVSPSGTTLDVTKGTGNYSSYVALGGLGPYTIKTITGAHDDGQVLYLKAPAGGITIDTTGNILPANASSTYTWFSPDLVCLIYDNSISKWTQTSVPTALTSGANTALSNLTTTSINTSLLPSGDLTRNLGSQTLRWTQLFTETIKWVAGREIDLKTVSDNGIDYNVNAGERHGFFVNASEYFSVSAGVVSVLSGFFTVSGTSNLNGNVNTDTDAVRSIGGTSTRFIINGQRYLGFKKSAGTPSVTDLPDGYFMVMKDTRQASGVGIKLWYNDANNLVSVALS